MPRLRTPARSALDSLRRLRIKEASRVCLNAACGHRPHVVARPDRRRRDTIKLDGTTYRLWGIDAKETRQSALMAWSADTRSSSGSRRSSKRWANPYDFRTVSDTQKLPKLGQ